MLSNDELLNIIEQAAKDGTTSLDLSNQGITELPPEIGRLTHLKKLILGRNKLSSFPAEIRHLTDLTTLDLTSNQFSVFPDEIVELVNLTELYLSANDLTEISSKISNLTKLETLYLNANKLTAIPHEISKLTNLLRLDLSGNQLSGLPHEIAMLTHLEGLDINGNPLPIPFEISSLVYESEKIINYYLKHHDTKTLNTEPQRWYRVYKDHDLQQIIEQALQTNINSLDLSHKNLTEFPREICELKNLVELRLSYNQITKLPKAITKLTNLKGIDLRYNQFTEIPFEISTLPNLSYLNLGRNQLTILSPYIQSFKKLTTLRLWHNQLRSLPPEIKNLNDLTLLDLQGNPLPIPPEILELRDQPQKILNYYFQYIEKQRKPLNEAKMVIVGQGAVGKTSLVKRLLEDAFNPCENTTEGIDIRRWNISTDETDIRLNIWDFGGQEIMHATHQFFLTKRSLYLLVLDSRLDEQENRTEYWLKIIQSFGGDSPVIVVCNKCDQHDLELDWRGLQAKYPNITVFATRVSCKTGEGIVDLRNLINREVGQLEHIRDELMLSWFAVKTQLEEMEEDYISYSRYQQMCETEGIADTLSQETLLGFLHDLGIILHFQDHPLLEDTNVLNPEWVTKGVYQILNSNELFQTKGELERASLDHILDPQRYPRLKHQFILDMMRKFELCFDFAEYAGERFLVPDLLAKEEPYAGDWNDSLAFQYHYDILPGSVISRFIVRMNAFIFKKTYWRTGVVLASENEKNKALVKADPEEKKIFIYVKGAEATRHTLLAIIRADFRKIHKTIQKLKVKEKVPVPGHPEIVVDYEHLLTLEELGEESFIPEGLRTRVSVSFLLHGIRHDARENNQGKFHSVQEQLRILRRQVKETHPGSPEERDLQRQIHELESH